MFLDMKSIEKILLLSLSLFALASCTKPKISVTADFTTDKQVYELYEDIKITNTSVAVISHCGKRENPQIGQLRFH